MSQQNKDAVGVQNGGAVRNPFDVMDVPDPMGPETMAFAAGASLEGSDHDPNAAAWGGQRTESEFASIAGPWCSRWNGGSDPTVEGDTKEKWKSGQAEVRLAEDRVYLRFNWDHGAREGMIEAQHAGADRLIGKYINLSDPKITRPWIGKIVSSRRIDGRWSGGRLDFRR